MARHRYVALRQAEWRDLLSLGETRISAFRIVSGDSDLESIDPRRLFAGAALGRLEDSARMVIGELTTEAPAEVAPTKGFRRNELVDLHLSQLQSFAVVEERFLNEVTADLEAARLPVRSRSTNELWSAWVDDEGGRRAHVAGMRYVQDACGVALPKRPKSAATWQVIADTATGRIHDADPRDSLLWFLRAQSQLFDATAAKRKTAAFWLALPLAVATAHPEGKDTDPAVTARLHKALGRLEHSTVPVDDAIDRTLATKLRSLRRTRPAIFNREFTPLVAAFFALHAYRIRNQRYDADSTIKQLRVIGEFDGKVATHLAAYLIGVELGLEMVHVASRHRVIDGSTSSHDDDPTPDGECVHPRLGPGE